MRIGRLRPNLAGVIVLIAVPVALVGVFGDLPAEPFKEPLPGELAEPPNLSIYAPKPDQLADVDFIFGAPRIEVGTRLPVWSRRHAQLTGTITFNGIKGSAGPIEVIVHLPPGSTLALSDDYEGERENEATITPLSEPSVGPAAEWRVSFETKDPCAWFFGVVGFTIKAPELAYAQGWGRQHLTIPYYVSFLHKDVIKAVDDGYGSSERCEQPPQPSQAPGVLALTTNEQYQRVSEVTASSDQTRGIHAWALPRGQTDSLVVEATVENTLVRYVADLAPDLLFLVIGVLLGATSFRRGRRSRSGQEP